MKTRVFKKKANSGYLKKISLQADQIDKLQKKLQALQLQYIQLSASYKIAQHKLNAPEDTNNDYT